MSKLDADGDGEISKEELEKALVELTLLGPDVETLVVKSWRPDVDLWNNYGLW